MRIWGRRLWVLGLPFTVKKEKDPQFDHEGFQSGHFDRVSRTLGVVDTEADGPALLHEAIHSFCHMTNIYLSETQIGALENAIFTTCRDPRNRWFLEYLKGE